MWAGGGSSSRLRGEWVANGFCGLFIRSSTQKRRRKQPAMEQGPRMKEREITKWRKLLQDCRRGGSSSRPTSLAISVVRHFSKWSFASNHEKGNLIKAKSSNIKLIYGLKLPVKSEWKPEKNAPRSWAEVAQFSRLRFLAFEVQG